MAILDLVLYPDDPLTQKALPYREVGPELLSVARDMVETMRAYEGVGLAGPQVGLRKRIFVVGAPDTDPICLINPEISALEGHDVAEEGCLSLPQIYGDVPRATRLHVRALNEYGSPVEFDAEGFVARIIQHEFDHLEGMMFFDRLDILTREALLQEWAEVRQQLLAVAKK